MPTIEARRQTKRGRFYEIPQGNEKVALYPSVTTILTCIGKPALQAWMAKVEREMVVEVSTSLYAEMARSPQLTESQWKHYLLSRLSATAQGQKEMQKAGDIGSLAHLMIENELNRRMGLPEKEAKVVKPEILEAADRAFGHWKEWASAVDLEPIASEQVVWSHKHKCAGTLDLLARVNRRLAVIDWKTGKYIYGEAHLQNAAYRMMVREMGHGEPELGIIVRLPKTVDDPKFEAVTADAEAPALEVFLHTLALWSWQEEKQSKWESEQ
jgi:hypothetical protein